MILWIEAVGFIAAIFTTAAGLPQLIKIIKTKHTKDISLGLIITFCIGLFLWLIYGILITSWPLIIEDAVTLSIWALILYYKLKYK
jgi:MtN3 and saliva related transmembrane protein